MGDYKHYIRLKENNVIIIKRFSSAFEEPQVGDICVNENGDRHYNDPVVNNQGQYLYKWDGTNQIERTPDELFDIDTYRSAKISELSHKCYESIISGLKSSTLGQEHEYDFDREEAQINLSGLMGAINAGTCPPVVKYKTKDAGYLPHTINQIKQLFMDGFVHKQTNLERFDGYRTTIKTGSKDEIDAITWE